MAGYTGNIPRWLPKLMRQQERTPKEAGTQSPACMGPWGITMRRNFISSTKTQREGGQGTVQTLPSLDIGFNARSPRGRSKKKTKKEKVPALAMYGQKLSSDGLILCWQWQWQWQWRSWNLTESKKNPFATAHPKSRGLLSAVQQSRRLAACLV